MPYKRRYRRKQKCPIPMYGKADRYVAEKAYSLAKLALRGLNVEYKFHDTQLTGSNVPTTAIINQISNIAQGDTAITRDGSQVKCVNLEIHWRVRQHATATETAVRVLIVKDSQTNGAIYTIADLLQDTSIFDSIVTRKNLDNMFRLHIMYDKVFFMSDSGNKNAYGSFNRALNQKLRFDGVAGDITDLASSSYSIVFLSDEGTNVPDVSVFSRLKYVDN